MARWPKRLIAFVTAMLLAPQAQASDRVLRFVGPLAFPPYSDLQDGQPVGSVPELATRLAGSLGIDLDIRIQPASRMAAELQRGMADMSILVPNTTLDNTPHMVRGTVPVGYLTINVYGLDTAPPARLEDIALEDTAVVIGFSYGGYRAKLDALGARLHEVSTPALALGLTLAGRTRYTLLYDLNFALATKDTPEELRARVKGATLFSSPIYIYMNAITVPDAARLVEEMEKTYQGSEPDRAKPPGQS